VKYRDQQEVASASLLSVNCSIVEADMIERQPVKTDGSEKAVIRLCGAIGRGQPIAGIQAQFSANDSLLLTKTTLMATPWSSVPRPYVELNIRPIM
jgi:hypothetical protein